jgi:DNA-binding MarR family transcriptional regulator
VVESATATTTVGADVDEVGQAAWRALQRLHAHLAGAINHDMTATTPLPLPLQDYNVLAVLNGAPGGRMRSVDLGRELGWERSRLSHHLDRMAQRDLVTKAPHPIDRRGVLAVMTPVGRGAFESATPAYIERVRLSFTARLSPRQLSELIDLAAAVEFTPVEPALHA